MSFTRYKKFLLVPAENFDEREGMKSSMLTDELILSNIPKKFLRNATTVLRYIKSKIHWNDKGEILDCNGDVITSSHISDLIRYVICPFGKVEPIGISAFRLLLEEINIPTGIINKHPLFEKRTHPPSTPTSSGWKKL